MSVPKDRASYRTAQRFRVGSAVMVEQESRGLRQATVVKHGRDVGGVYTRVRYSDGTTDDVHREALKKAGLR